MAEELKIDITPDVAKGTYSNLVIITHSPAEVVLDFAQMLPGPQKGHAVVQNRVIMPPIHAKRLLSALIDNIRKYESQFGEIKDPQQPQQVEGDTVPYDILGKA